ncbi:MAG: transporter substrate-binding domain-containing protein [Bacteroidales bacterium]|nr:transporter substrate-binding domain-containing protein [Bacteroidales bacterium]
MKLPTLKGPSKQRLWMYITALVGVIMLMVMLRTCSQPNPMAPRSYEHSGGDTIDVAIDYAPLSLYRYADTLGGFNYDLINQMRALGGRPMKLHPVVTISEAMAGLDEGYYDVVVADIPSTLEYQERYAFSEPVFLDRQVLVQTLQPDSTLPIQTQLDLAGKQVWVMANSPVVTRLRNLSAEIGDTIYIQEDTVYGPEQLFIMTAVGEIPLAVVNERTAKSLIGDYPQADISTNVSFTQFQTWLMRKDDTATQDTINALLRRIKASPAYEELESRYLK